jgi:uncharacterized protein YndB with AHSA1/START domain
LPISSWREARLIDAPRENLFRWWTEPALIQQWFKPPPCKTFAAELDSLPVAPA